MLLIVWQIIVLYVTGSLNTVLTPAHQEEMRRYLYNHQVLDYFLSSWNFVPLATVFPVVIYMACLSSYWSWKHQESLKVAVLELILQFSFLIGCHFAMRCRLYFVTEFEPLLTSTYLIAEQGWRLGIAYRGTQYHVWLCTDVCHIADSWWWAWRGRI